MVSCEVKNIVNIVFVIIFLLGLFFNNKIQKDSNSKKIAMGATTVMLVVAAYLQLTTKC
jgi:hypothetical protein